MSWTIGARVIDSTPPATMTSPSPAMMAWAALLTRLQPRAAEAIDGLARDLDGQPGQQGRHAGHVAVVLAGAVGVAQHDVVDGGRVDAGCARPRHGRPAQPGRRGAPIASAPPCRPMGVRTASTIQASRTWRRRSRLTMPMLPLPGEGRGACRGALREAACSWRRGRAQELHHRGVEGRGTLRHHDVAHPGATKRRASGSWRRNLTACSSGTHGSRSP